RNGDPVSIAQHARTIDCAEISLSCGPPCALDRVLHACPASHTVQTGPSHFAVHLYHKLGWKRRLDKPHGWGRPAQHQEQPTRHNRGCNRQRHHQLLLAAPPHTSASPPQTPLLYHAGQAGLGEVPINTSDQYRRKLLAPTGP